MVSVADGVSMLREGPSVPAARRALEVGEALFSETFPERSSNDRRRLPSANDGAGRVRRAVGRGRDRRAVLGEDPALRAAPPGHGSGGGGRRAGDDPSGAGGAPRRAIALTGGAALVRARDGAQHL